MFLTFLILMARTNSNKEEEEGVAKEKESFHWSEEIGKRTNNKNNLKNNARREVFD